MKAETISVTMPRMIPFGMSRFGSTDSSAASGSCSMARNSQTAKGSVARTPEKPNGKNEPPPSGSSTALPSGPTPMLSAKREKSILGMALIQKNTRTASEISVMTSVTLKESSSPKTLSARNIA